MTRPDQLGADTELAHLLADVADGIALDARRGPVERFVKADGSPVSSADLEVERAQLDLIRVERPGDAVLSEEDGRSGSGPRRWILDPIDGTRRYLAREDEGWGTHVALEVDGRLAVVVLTRPAEGLRWWAVRGGGAYRSTADDPRSRHDPVRLSGTDRLGDAYLGGHAPGRSPQRRAVAAAATWEWHPSPVTALLDGDLDAVLNIGGHPWDLAPAALLVPEAGGTFHDPDGGDRFDRRWALATNGHLDAALLDVLDRAADQAG